MDVLIFDDDHVFAASLVQIVESLGLSTGKRFDGHQGFERILKDAPKLVILDVMMPGMDGASICRAVKSHEITKHTKVLIITAKAFEEDRATALAAGADAFLPKAAGIKAIKETVTKLLGAELQQRNSEMSLSPEGALQVKIWGCYGPSQTPDPAKPTSCVSIRFGDRLAILDAGSGLLTQATMMNPTATEMWLLLTHYHQDHINALGIMRNSIPPGMTLKVAGPEDPRAPLHKIVSTLAKDAGPKFKVEPYLLRESALSLWPDVKLTVLQTFHPGVTLAFCIEHGERSIVYCPDNQMPTGEESQSNFLQKFEDFISGADLLLHDSQYLDAEEQNYAGGGHSYPAQIVDLADRAGVKHLVLFHLNPEHTDQFRAAALESITAKLQSRESFLKVEWARPVSTISI